MCNKWEQTEQGRRKNQVLRQCWFPGGCLSSVSQNVWSSLLPTSGSHSDVGGGFAEHDLADISLVWMAVSKSSVFNVTTNTVAFQAQIEDALGLDIEYLAHLPKPVAPWGKQKPHQ